MASEEQINLINSINQIYQQKYEKQIQDLKVEFTSQIQAVLQENQELKQEIQDLKQNQQQLSGFVNAMKQMFQNLGNLDQNTSKSQIQNNQNNQTNQNIQNQSLQFQQISNIEIKNNEYTQFITPVKQNDPQQPSQQSPIIEQKSQQTQQQIPQQVQINWKKDYDKLEKMFFYMKGNGQDQREQVKILEDIIEVQSLGETDIGYAYGWLGFAYLNGVQKEQDYEKAKELFTKSSENYDNEIGIWGLGYCHIMGYGTQINEPEGLKLYEKAGEMGVKRCLAWLGEYYFYDMQNKKLAKMYWQKAAKLGEIEAMYSLQSQNFEEEEEDEE